MLARIRRSRAHGQWFVALIAVAMCASSSRAAAETVTTAVAVKAAFLFNFAKFAEWPPDALVPGQRISLCVVGDSAVADALEQTISGRPFEGHELSVQVLPADGPLRSCHLLYVSGQNPKRAVQVLDTIKGAPVLSVSDGDHFAEAGGIAQLVQDRDRMRFAINVAAAKRAHLVLSAKLLSLAQIVKDDTDAAR